MLSSQTKDETTFEAMNRLKEKTLTPISIQNIQVSELETLLHPVSFYKVCQVKKTANIILILCLPSTEQGKVLEANSENTH